MNTWKWSTGEAYYKSARPEKNEKPEKTQSIDYEYDSQTNAINQSLAVSKNAIKSRLNFLSICPVDNNTSRI